MTKKWTPEYGQIVVTRHPKMGSGEFKFMSCDYMNGDFRAQVLLEKDRKEGRRFAMKTLLKVLGIVILGLYFTACSTFPDLTGRAGADEYRQNLARVNGNRYISDQPYYDKIKAQGLLEEESLREKTDENVIEIYFSE